MTPFLRFYVFAFFLFSSLTAQESAVTYEMPGGRFGDQLIAYMHAKWISYKYEIPLLYKQFSYSKDLILHDKEREFTGALERSFAGGTINIETKSIIDPMLHALYVVQYFPESAFEMTLQKWPYFPIDWKDEGFLLLLRSLITPKEPIPLFDLPKDRVSIAVHVRRGGGFDDPSQLLHWPLKFPSDDFYISQIRKTYALLNNAPIFAFIFTDDPSPEAIVEKYTLALSDIDIRFGYRTQGNRHNSNVLADLFNMLQFDCLIRPESNFSIVAERLGNYHIVINPTKYQIKNNQSIITEQNVFISSKNQFFSEEEFIDLNKLTEIHPHHYYETPYKEICLFTPSRTGSTLVYNILKFLFKNVHKTHDLHWHDDTTTYVTTIRNPIDACISVYRILLFPAHPPSSPQVAIDLCKFVASQFQSLEELTATGKKPLILRYEDFEKNIDYIFDRIDDFFSIKITDQDKALLRKALTKENVLKNIKHFSNFHQHDEGHYFHGSHIDEGEITESDKLILKQQLIEQSQPFADLFTRWGYQLGI